MLGLDLIEGNKFKDVITQYPACVVASSVAVAAGEVPVVRLRGAEKMKISVGSVQIVEQGQVVAVRVGLPCCGVLSVRVRERERTVDF